MATRYFDSVGGNNTTGDGSIDNPWATYDGKYASTAAGDTLLFKRGTTQEIATIYRGLRSGTNNVTRTYYGAYGDGDKPVFTNPTATGNMLLNGSSAHDITIEDIAFDATGCSIANIYFASQSGSSVYNITLRRCEFKNCNSAGLSFSREGTSNGNIYNVIVDDCDSYNNGGHGIALTGTENTIRNCRTRNNGATNTNGGHGISASYTRTTVTTGWSGSGPYSRAIAPTGATVYFVSYGTGFTRLAENTSTPTSPGVGEFGQASGTLYVNTGAAVDGVSIVYAWGRCENNVIEYCSSYENIKNAGAPYWEGHGIALDDYSSNNIVRGNKCYNNEGLGISVNRGDANTIYGNLCYGNDLPGIALSIGNANLVYNNTFSGNNLSATSAYTTEVNSTGTNNVFKNNVLVTSETNGINVTGAGHSGDNNLVFGATNATNGGTFTDTLTSDPLLSAAYTPSAAGPCAAAGVFVSLDITDLEGRAFHYPPTLGAVECLYQHIERLGDNGAITYAVGNPDLTMPTISGAGYLQNRVAKIIADGTANATSSRLTLEGKLRAKVGGG